MRTALGAETDWVAERAQRRNDGCVGWLNSQMYDDAYNLQRRNYETQNKFTYYKAL